MPGIVTLLASEPTAPALLSAIAALAPVHVWPAYTKAAWAAALPEGARFQSPVGGTSMNLAGIPDGAWVTYRKSRNAAHGDIVLVRWAGGANGGALIKRLVVTASGQRWLTSVSDDPRWGAWRLHPRTQIIAIAEAAEQPDGSWLEFPGAGVLVPFRAIWRAR